MPTLDEALALWKGSGYKRINGYLLSQKTADRPNSKRLVRIYTGAAPPDDEDAYKVEDIVSVLKRGMKDIDTSQKYYRGSSSKRKVNCHFETFISITVNKDDAEAFADDGLIYEISITEGVKGVKTGVEGEILLEDGCYWEFIGDNKVIIHSPSAEKDYPWCTSIIRRGGKRDVKTRRNARNKSRKSRRNK